MDLSKLRFSPSADAVCRCQEKPEISSSNSRSGYLSITVSDSRLQQELNWKTYYYSYLITTNLTDNGEPRSVSTVRRRFSDFQTMMDRLIESYPDIGRIPYFIAEFAKSKFAKSKHGGFKKTEDQRMVVLEKCLWKLASHPVTRMSKELREFLQVNPKILKAHDEFLKKNKKLKKTEHRPIDVSQKVESLQAIGGTFGKECESPFGTYAQFEKAILEGQRLLRLAHEKEAAAKKASRDLRNDLRPTMPIINFNPFPYPTKEMIDAIKLVEDLKIRSPKTSDGRDLWECRAKEMIDAIKDDANAKISAYTEYLKRKGITHNYHANMPSNFKIAAYKEYLKFREIHKSELESIEIEMRIRGRNKLESIEKEMRGLTIS